MAGIKYPTLHDRQALEALVDQGLTVVQIAERVGCSEASAHKALRSFGLKACRSGHATRSISPFERPLRIGGCQCERPLPGPEGCQKCGRELPGISRRLVTQPFFRRGRMIA